MDQPDFFSQYLEYTKDSEVPIFFHRWSAIVGLGAYLGRDLYFNHGHFNIYPNMYCMLIGNPGTRKSTAIKVMKSVMKLAGYTTIAANKTSKEKFMLDLSEGIGSVESDSMTADEMLDKNLWGDSIDSKPPSECFIMADEFNNFIGTGNLEFISLLTELWDYEGSFSNKIKTGKSIHISNPTISILGGSTPTSFSTTFPAEIFGQGFFSRLLLIYGEPNGKKITFPTPPTSEATADIVSALQRVKIASFGATTLNSTAKNLLNKIYIEGNCGVGEDVRFESYYSRRFNHLMKLCIIVSAARYAKEITEIDVVHANTVLTHTEYLMPKALGEFGKAKNSDVSHKIVSIIDNAPGVVTFKTLWESLHSDLSQLSELGELLHNLIAANKIQAVKSGGFLPKRRIVEEVNSDTIDYSFLTREEKDIRK